MAKLSAYGQVEDSRWEKSKEYTAEEDDLISWKRMTYAFMTNGRLLTKEDVVFRSDGRYSYGWKVSAHKYEDVAKRMEAIERLTAKGYVEVTK